MLSPCLCWNFRRSALSENVVISYTVFCVLALGDNAAIFRRMAGELRSQVGWSVWSRQLLSGIDEASTNWA